MIVGNYVAPEEGTVVITIPVSEARRYYRTVAGVEKPHWSTWSRGIFLAVEQALREAAE